jgi:hypothetical protein
MGQRTVPVEYLYHQGKAETGQVNNPYYLVANSPQSATYQKKDPDEMYDNDEISKKP